MKTLLLAVYALEDGVSASTSDKKVCLLRKKVLYSLTIKGQNWNLSRLKTYHMSGTLRPESTRGETDVSNPGPHENL